MPKEILELFEVSQEEKKTDGPTIGGVPVRQATLVADLCDAVAQFLEKENANQKF